MREIPRQMSGSTSGGVRRKGRIMDGCKTQMQHYAWIDGLKVFACFLVIMQHTLSSNWGAPFTNGEDISEFWIAVNAVFTLAKAGVPLFFMCSGAVMLQKWRSIREIWSHSIPNLLVPYVTWMLVYGIRDVFSLYESGNLTMRTGINAIAKGSSGISVGRKCHFLQ